jgi:hypothetical protein
MVERPEPADVQRETARMLALARQLREAATRSGRPDVVAEVDGLIALVAGDGQRPGGDDKGNAVLKILDGLGL